MSQTKKRFIQKAVSVATSVTTVAWLSGVGVLLPGLPAYAIADGDLLTVVGNPDVYIVKTVGTKMFKRLILNPQIFNQYGHLKWSNIQTVAQATMNMYTTSDLTRCPECGADSPKVWRLVPNGDVGTKHWVNMTAANFETSGYDWDSIYTINANEAAPTNYATGGDVTYTPPPPPVSSGLTASLSPTTPAASHVARGVSYQEVMKVKLTNGGSSSVTVTSLTVTKGGIHASTDVTAVGLFEGNTLKSALTFNTTTNQAVFTGLNVMVPAGGSNEVSLRLSLAAGAGAGNTIYLYVNSASHVTASDVVNGTFPIVGATMTIAGASVGVLDVDAVASSTGADLLSGSTDQELASWNFDTTTTEGARVKSVTVTEIGTSVDSDVMNLKLKYLGTQIGSTVVALTNGKATFDLTAAPFEVLAGGSKDLYLYGDTAGNVTSERTVRFEITVVNDVVAVGMVTGGSILVTNDDAAAFSNGKTTGQTHTIKQGTLSVTVDSATQPSAQTYIRGSVDNLMTTFKFTAGSTEGARITELKLTLTGTGASTDIANIKLFDGATQVGNTSSIIGTTVTFGSNITGLDPSGLFDVPKSGNKVISVKASVPTGANATATIGLRLTNPSTEMKADGLSSMADLPTAAITPATQIPASNLNHSLGANGTLALALAPDNPAAADFSPGATGVTFAKWSLTAGTGENISVSSVTLTLENATNTAAASGDFLNVKLLWDGVQVGNSVASPGSTAAFSFTKTVTKGTVATLSAVADVPTNANTVWADGGDTGTDADARTTLAGSNIVAVGVSSSATISVSGGTLQGSNMDAVVGTLTVALSSSPPATTFVANSTNTNVARVLLTAGTSENTRLTSLKISVADSLASTGTACVIGDFTAASSTTASAESSSYALYDGATLVAGPKNLTDGGSAAADTVTFDGLSVDITKGTQKALDLKLTVIAATASPLCFGVATLADATANGLSSGASATVTGNGSSPAMTFVGSGTATLVIDAATPLAENKAVGISGVSGVEFARYKFTATNEDMALMQIKLTRVNGANADFASVALYDGATKISADAFFSEATSTTFNFANTTFVVPKDGSKILSVKASLNGTSNGVTAADAPRLDVATSSDVVVEGKSSGTQKNVATSTAASGTNHVVANAQTLYRTTITVSKSSTSPSGALIPGALTELLHLDVTNNGTQDATLTLLEITPSFAGTISTDTTVDMQLFDSADLATALAGAPANACTATDTGFTALTSGTKVTLFNEDATDGGGTSLCGAPITVAPGQTKKLVVKMDTTGLTTTGNSVRLDVAAVAELGWKDGVVSTEVTTLTKNLPITGGTLVK